MLGAPANSVSEQIGTLVFVSEVLPVSMYSFEPCRFFRSTPCLFFGVSPEVCVIVVAAVFALRCGDLSFRLEMCMCV